MGRKKKCKTHSTAALPWRVEVASMLDNCRTYPAKILAIDQKINQLQEVQGFDLEDRAVMVEIKQLEREKEELTEFRDIMRQAVNMLPDDIRQFIELGYLSEKPLSPTEVTERLSYSDRAFYYRRRQALDLLAEYLNVKPVIKESGANKQGD